MQTSCNPLRQHAARFTRVRIISHLEATYGMRVKLGTGLVDDGPDPTANSCSIQNTSVKDAFHTFTLICFCESFNLRSDTKRFITGYASIKSQNQLITSNTPQSWYLIYLSIIFLLPFVLLYAAHSFQGTVKTYKCFHKTKHNTTEQNRNNQTITPLSRSTVYLCHCSGIRRQIDEYRLIKDIEFSTQRSFRARVLPSDEIADSIWRVAFYGPIRLSFSSPDNVIAVYIFF